MENGRIHFAKELRKYSEELDLINQINYNLAKLFEMSDEEIDNALQALKKQNEFLDQRIFELKQELLKINKKIIKK